MSFLKSSFLYVSLTFSSKLTKEISELTSVSDSYLILAITNFSIECLANSYLVVYYSNNFLSTLPSFVTWLYGVSIF